MVLCTHSTFTFPDHELSISLRRAGRGRAMEGNSGESGTLLTHLGRDKGNISQNSDRAAAPRGNSELFSAALPFPNLHTTSQVI